MRPFQAVFILDPPEQLDPGTDTSLALICESLRRGHRVFYCTLDDLYLVEGDVWGRMRPVTAAVTTEIFRSGPPQDSPLKVCDLVWMRKDPPVDEKYIHATHLLDRLPEGVLQINPAGALRNHCEKIIPLYFPGMAPETVVSCNPVDLAAFLEQHRRIVIKPLNECSGRGVFALTAGADDSLFLLDRATMGGRRFVQGQKFLPAIAGGDKRVLMLGGEILGWVQRTPAEGDFRSNVNAGGHCVPCELTAGDRALCARLTPWLVREEIHLAGVDIVGSHVLEVNITSPSCLREMNDLGNLHLEQKIIDYIERRCRI